MTVSDLQQLVYLEKLIQCEQDRLDELRDQAGLHSPGLSDMPKAPGAKDKLGELVPKIVDQEAEIQENIKEYSETRERILRFINHIPNPKIKLIIILKFVNQKTWQEVAEYMDNGKGKITSDAVRMAVNSYLEREACYNQ